MPKPVRRKTTPELVLLRNSERGVFLGCRQQWQWSYREGWVAKGAPARALGFGDLAHQALAGWYIPGKKRGMHPVEGFRLAYEAYQELHGEGINMRNDDDEWVDAMVMATFMMNNYVATYGNEPHIEVISPEMPCQVDVHDPETGEYLFTYVFKVDAVYRDHKKNGALGMFEHKTSASAEKPGTIITLDSQGRSYWTFGVPWLRDKGILGPKEDVRFLMYNILRKAMPDTRPQNEKGQYLNQPTGAVLKLKAIEMGLDIKGLKVADMAKVLTGAGVDVDQMGEVSKRQPAPYFNRVPIYLTPYTRDLMLERVINEFREMQMVKRGELAILKNPGDRCKFCQFRDVCELHEDGSDWQSILQEGYTKQDPYGDHVDMDRSFV